MLNARKVPSTGNSNRVEQPTIAPGTYPVRLVQLIDLGLQAQNQYQGKEKPPVNMIYVTYEMLDEFMIDEDGKELEDKPRWISEQFPFHSLDADLAKSSKRYYAIDPDEVHEGDWTQLLGAPANAALVNKAGTGKNAGKTYTNVQALSPMRPKDAAKAPELVNPTKVFTLDEPDLEVFNGLPDFLKDRIKGNLNYQGSKLQALLDGGETTPATTTDDSDDDGEW